MSPSKKSLLHLLLHKFWKPSELYKIYKLQKSRKQQNNAYNDAELKLYHKIMPGDFLHYGYFENPNITGAEISLQQFYSAQLRYATNILQLVSDTTHPILDIGCGMGGLLQLMNKQNWNAIGVTPDKNQTKYIAATYQNKIHDCKLEDMPTDSYNNYFGTIITSESVQYLQLPIALPIIKKIMKQNGKWIACDYFRIGDATEKSGHHLQSFMQLLEAHHLTITYQQDITANILPTLDFIHIWATQVVLPLLQFGEEKMLVKAPGIHYGIQDAIPEIFNKINKNIDIINPTTFATQKQYLLMVIENKPS
jgi:cyclopropane fatty-acyl-phospholipid synthase-like methyltransferase